MLSILSGAQRRGTWSVPKNLRVIAVMGGVDLDFRDAEFGPGVTEVNVTAVMGGIAIVVPPKISSRGARNATHWSLSAAC